MSGGLHPAGGQIDFDDCMPAKPACALVLDARPAW
jgi:hypothetical protein